MPFFPVTAQNVFVLLKASPGLILKSKSGKRLNFISLEIFSGTKLEEMVRRAEEKPQAGAAGVSSLWFPDYERSLMDFQ